MSGPTRRHLLGGVAAGGALLGAAQWRREATTDRTAAAAPSDALAVSIVETNAPVPAGEYLEVTVALENGGTEAIRPAVDVLVGGDAEPIGGRRELTIPPGETRTFSAGYYTYPVPRDDEFPIRVEANGETDERTVGVTAAGSLPDSSPAESLAVRPGTEVLFEASALEAGVSQTTLWWIDGERVGGTLASPWQAIYYGEFDAHYWRESFEEPGRHDVAAAVLPNEGDRTYAARWTVQVTDDGVGGPSIEARRPAGDEVSVAPGESVEFELEVAADGDLDRVVWWLTQADVVLGVSDLEGETDVATLSTDARCHTCRVVPWVIAADGTATALEEGWRIDAPSEGGAPDSG